MDPASLKGLADAAGQAHQAGTAPREPDAMALPEMAPGRKPSRRKRSARPSAARHSESPEVRELPRAVLFLLSGQACFGAWSVWAVQSCPRFRAVRANWGSVISRIRATLARTSPAAAAHGRRPHPPVLAFPSARYQSAVGA